MKKPGNQKQINDFAFSAMCFAAALLIILVLYALCKIAPFGRNSLANYDANIDYIDCFAYLKDVLSGKNNGIYSFSKGLGGNMIAVLTTGYASPLNLLVVFFEKTQLHIFFNLVVAGKIGLAAGTMCFFLRKRFGQALRPVFVFTLSMSYAFSQFAIAQASNIFFLEGMYMLPLFMLGAYLIVRQKKPYCLLLSVAYNVLFAWYNGAVNCIFTVVWVIFELYLLSTERKLSFKEAVQDLLLSAFAGGVGVLLSGIFFLPTVAALGKGNEGTLNFELFNGSGYFRGNIITVLTNYSVGSLSTNYMVALFCGNLALLCCAAVFFSSRFKKKQKAAVGCLLLFSTLCYYWQPLFLVFSLFKDAASFWYRYSYLGSFTLLFAAALFLAGVEKEQMDSKIFILLAAAFSAITFLFYKDTAAKDLKWVYVSAFLMLLISYMLSELVKRSGSSRTAAKKPSAFLCAVSLAELCLSCVLLIQIYELRDIDQLYVGYVREGQAQIRQLSEADSGTYRITQTRTRGNTPGNLTATYDEPEQFNFWSLTAYTSCPDDVQRTFLDKAGYRMNGEDMYIVNTSILPVDSLLGVKYVLSPYAIDGLVEETQLDERNGKKVFLNPYALPMAFVSGLPDAAAESGNPFEYQNALFSALAGRKTDVFIPIGYTEEKGVLQSGKKGIYYELHVPEGNYALYGNLPWKTAVGEKLYTGDNLLTEYAKWTSPSVFYIPQEADPVILTVAPEAKKLSIEDVQFYAVDLDLLGELTEKWQAASVEDAIIRNGYASFHVNADADSAIITSIPYDPDWRITRNGKACTPELLGDCLMVIPLEEGDNTVEMSYHPSGLTGGCMASSLGLVLLILFVLGDRYLLKHRKRTA